MTNQKNVNKNGTESTNVNSNEAVEKQQAIKQQPARKAPAKKAPVKKETQSNGAVNEGVKPKQTPQQVPQQVVQQNPQQRPQQNRNNFQKKKTPTPQVAPVVEGPVSDEPLLKIIPLGGLNEIGKNMTVVQYEEDIFIIDSGLAFPEDELLGIDVVIPDITYLKKNLSKIKGIVLTHGHEDHIGALPYVLREIKVPVYGTRLTLGLVENKLKEHRLNDVKLVTIVPGQIIKLGVFEVEPIRVCHSIADAVAYAITTPYGKIVHTGDFKIDFTPIDGQKMDLARFARLGDDGVLALLADSTNVVREGYTMSESTVGETFENIFKHATARIIVASFSSNIHRLQQIINAAYLNNRRVAFSGRSMLNVSSVATELGYLKLPEDIIIDIKDIDRYPENEIVVITTGSQGEPMSALVRMANSEHRSMEIVPGDLVILSSSPIPGNEKSIGKIINQLTKKGATMIYESLADVHVSGHAKQEELKLMHSLVKPKYFMPVHGEYVHLDRHKKLALELGMSPNNIFILSNGGVLEFTSKTAKIGKSVPAGRVFIDGLGVGDVGNIVLRDRKHLSEDGLIIIVVALSSATGELVNGPDLISRGFVYVRESETLMDGASKVVEAELAKCLSKNIKDWASLKSSVRDALSQYIYQSTKRSPMILPIFMEV
ncbi:ribonuclease J [Fusibacter sp. 3D3]|uniref:ribonuclease J n=1 Tax=Fusibacter sp. 3D3 TaxID=1048380 RepID=UPI0008555310|nr:ribonuclease J [Fusibacter sp. 3D3]GAU76952.1 ribonuclease J2 [Fusibacter sp. 3D3]